MPKQKKTNVVVTVDDAHAADIADVSNDCRAAGLNISESLEFLGQLIGEIDAEKEADLRNVPGVVSVETSRAIQLPPPDDDVQ